MLKYTSPDHLIVDDLGLMPLRGDEPADLYNVIRYRYERGALILTSNRALPEWPPLFGDPLLASAAWTACSTTPTSWRSRETPTGTRPPRRRPASARHRPAEHGEVVAMRAMDAIRPAGAVDSLWTTAQRARPQPAHNPSDHPANRPGNS